MIYKRLLMCRPIFFNVIHQNMNAHMKMQRNVNKTLACYQWENLVNKLYMNGVKLSFIDPVKNLVDMVFTANSALLYNNKAIISNFEAIPRIPESDQFLDYYHGEGYDVYNMKTKFEGAGDALFSHNLSHLWIGSGFRTCNDALYEVKDILASKINYHSLKLVNKHFYHLDTCFCPINDDILLLYEDAFDNESLNKIYDVYDRDKCIKVSEEDAYNFACNSIIFEKSNKLHIIGNKYSDDLVSSFDNNNIGHIENDMSEFLLSGGSTKCCVINLS